MRPISNLTKLSEFKLDPRAQRSGFIGLYDGRVGSKNVLLDIYWALVSSALCPAVRDFECKTEWLRDWFAGMREGRMDRVVKSTLRKNMAMRRLEFRTPLWTGFDGGLMSVVPTQVFQAVRNASRDEEYRACNNLENTPLANGQTISGEQAAAEFSLPKRGRELLKDCLLSVEATLTGQTVTVWATFVISLEEAEYLTNSTFTEMRLSDLYPTLIEWTASYFGRMNKPPKSVTKVSSIAEGVRQAVAGSEVKPRVGLDSLVTDIKGDFYVIPEVDQSAEYEQQLLDFGLLSDGSYTWYHNEAERQHPANEGTPEGMSTVIDPANPDQIARRRMPRNMPIFSDWLNDKFCYSNTSGNLAVYDLSDTAPVKAFHLTQLLNTPLTEAVKDDSKIGKLLRLFLSAAVYMDNSLLGEKYSKQDIANGSSPLRPFWNDLVDNHKSNFTKPMDMLRDAVYMHTRLYETYRSMVARNEPGIDTEDLPRAFDLTLADICPGTQVAAFKTVARMLEKACRLIEANIEVLYARYSVMNSLRYVALSRIFSKYGAQFTQLKETDRQEREVYFSQGVDDSYDPPAIPFIKKDLMFQPHQAKLDNIMRASPDFAAYDVDAGGGKTILVMTNIFNEMQKGHCKRPIVCCPSTLVSQYVEEVVYVAEGRVNVIPVTNSTMRMHGIERLTMMLNRAPINTIVVTDFDFVKGRGRQISYGNKSVNVFTNAEWLRTFEFDLIAVDESHKLANLASSRREGMARLMQDIPKKRLASGTFVNNTITDLVSQIALFDPTIFGDKDAFLEQYANSQAGGKATSWKPGAERQIRQKIKEHVVMASARRKEWAALLPPSREEFVAVDLTDNQRALYESILEETTELIKEAIEKNADLKQAMEDGENAAEELEGMLKPYLARLERFLSAPEVDEAAEKFLVLPQDRVSPKVQAVYDRCYAHISSGVPGKILIFTNYLASAEAVFNNAPADLRKRMIHYTAEKKMEARSQFARNDKLDIMVGASSSMDTGLNFQHVSRLIRMETVWTPGLIEQGNSRINRPQLKKAEERRAVYFDWLLVNRTIDITKSARLIAKMVSKAKFDEADVPEYQQITDQRVISMNLDSIAAMNDFENELAPYLQSYTQYKRAEENEYRRYREMNPDKLAPVQAKSGGLLPNSKLMSRVPYVPGMTIYGADQLGLVRYDAFVHQDLTEMETEDSSAEDGGTPEKDDGDALMKAKWAAELKIANGMPVHTEFGDGVIYGARKKVWVRFTNGSGTMRIPKLQVFVITRTTTNSKDMRTELLKAAGDMPLDAPIEVPVEEGAQTAKRRQNEEAPTVVKDDSIHASFSFAVINDMLAIVMNGEDNPRAASAVQSFGFKMSPEYWFTKIRGPKILFKLMMELHKKKFTLTKKNSEELKVIYEELKSAGRERMQMPGFATSMQIKDFTREQIKPSSDPYEMKMYARVEDGQLYLCLPKRGQAANARAIKVPSEMIRWVAGGGELEFIRLVKNKAEAISVLKEIKAAGIIIDNEKSLSSEFKGIKMHASVEMLR